MDETAAGGIITCTTCALCQVSATKRRRTPRRREQLSRGFLRALARPRAYRPTPY